MKKILALVLALVLSLSFASVALSEYNMFTYQHPVFGYTMKAPADWLYLDSQNIASIMKDPSVAGNFGNIDVETYAQQCIANEMAMFIMPNGVNFNVVSEYIGAPYTAEQLVALLLPTLRSQYQQILGDVDFLVEGDVFKAGDNEYAYIMYVTGDTIGAQYCMCESGRMYYLTLTTTSALNTLEYIQIEKMFDQVLKSFEE